MIPAWMTERDEDEAFDRKREWPSNRIELLHDLLCLCNSYVDSERYLVFGIDDSRTVVGVGNDPHRLNNAQLQDYLRGQRLNRIPTVRVMSHEQDGLVVHALEIRNRPDKPFFVSEDKSYQGKTIRAGVVYTRIGDTNVPLGEAAPEEMVELMWRERFGIGMAPLARFHGLLEDEEAWVQPDELTPLYHEIHPEFTIVVGETMADDFREEWSQRFPDPHARSYLVSARYLGTVLEHYLFVSCDGGRHQVPCPKRDGAGRFWIHADSPAWMVSELLNRRSDPRMDLRYCGVELLYGEYEG